MYRIQIEKKKKSVKWENQELKRIIQQNNGKRYRCKWVLHQDYGWRIADIHKLKYPNIARRMLSYHANIVTGKEKIKDRWKFNKGRSRLLNDRHGRRLQRTLKFLRSAVKLSTACQLKSRATIIWTLVKKES